MTRPSEDALIARYFAPLAGRGGFGLRDDAALATPRPGHDLVVTKDMLIAGVHFFPDDPPDAIARKALRVNLSDLAAKGAEPMGFLLGLGLPQDWTEPWLAALAGGFGDDAYLFGCPLLGGDTVAMPSTDRPGPLTLSITAFGEVPAGRMVPRVGTRAGDGIYVSGTIGDAVLGLYLKWARDEDRGWIARLSEEHRAALLARHLCPHPRLALRDALRDHARAAMDVSDGLIGDLEKMLRLEGLTATVAADAVPLSPACRAVLAARADLMAALLSGGDDYEVLCAVPPAEAAGFEEAARRAGVPVGCIATAREGAEPLALVGAGGEPLDLARRAFQHFT